MALLCRALFVSSVGQTVAAFACVPYLRNAKSPIAFASSVFRVNQMAWIKALSGIQPEQQALLSRVPYSDGRHY